MSDSAVCTQLVNDVLLQAFKFIIKRVEMKEPCAVISMSGIGKRTLYDAVNEHLHKNISDRKVCEAIIKDKGEFDLFLEEIGKNFVPCICVLRLSLTDDCLEQIEKLESLRLQYYTDFIPVIIGSVCNIYNSLKFKPQVLSKSLLILKPYKPEVAVTFLELFEKVYKFNLKPETRSLLINLSGGHTGLLKSLFMIALDSDNHIPEVSELVEQESILMWLYKIVNDLPQEVWEELEKSNENLILQKFGYLSGGKLFSPLLEAYIKSRRRKLNTESKQDLMNDFLLSYTEKQVFNLLKENTGSIITRSQIADALWGDQVAEKYSEWAIDHVIYRIRSKLKAAGVPVQIVTKKKQGVVLREVVLSNYN